MCIKPEALLSGLVGRIERDGYLVTRADLEALLGAGVSRRAIDAQMETLTPSAAARHAQATLATL